MCVRPSSRELAALVSKPTALMTTPASSSLPEVVRTPRGSRHAALPSSTACKRERCASGDARGRYMRQLRHVHTSAA
eukprot:scaffold20647_cov69-Phaeocystis_antarctica.AAC.2